MDSPTEWTDRAWKAKEIGRRRLLQRFGHVATAGSGATLLARRSRGRKSDSTAADEKTKRINLTTTVVGTGKYHYLPFDVPQGVNRVDVELTKGNQNAEMGVGLFDYRGAQYGSDGFRGVYGAERNRFFVSAGNASQSFCPGALDPGTYTVFVPVFRAPTPTDVKVSITLTFGPEGSTPPAGPEPRIVNPHPGWYRGDLHCHTPASSDAWASKSALSPKEWSHTAEAIGLDFVSLTDHNVITQNRHLASNSTSDVLLLAGEEMTNWFHGHATVTGLDPGEWLDCRQRPAGVPLGEQEARIERFFAEVDRLGAYAAVAHPAAGHIAWQFFGDGETNPDARPHGLEVWNGNWDPTDEAAVAKWDDLLRRGWRVWANGGSDTHGTDDPSLGNVPGNPTTVVYASELSEEAIVDGLKRGRSFVTRSPDGPELYLSAVGPAKQRAMVGGTVRGEATDTVTLVIEVRQGAGKRLHVIRDGEPVRVTPIEKDTQIVTVDQQITVGGYVRTELRGTPRVDAAEPIDSRGDMVALTNPIFLERTR